MKKYTTLIFFVFIATISFAQTVYVAAPSGLKLRRTADAKAEVIKTLIYGAKLDYIADAEPKVAHKTKEAEGFYLNGFWQKVVAGKDTGYVFDAFLLPFKPFTTSEYEAYDDEISRKCKQPELHLLEHWFGKDGEVYDLIKYTGEDTVYLTDKTNPYCQQAYKIAFDNNKVIYEFAAYSRIAGTDLTGYNQVTFKGYNINTVYALVLGYTFIANQDVVKSTYKNNTITIEGTVDGFGCSSTIAIKGDKIVWKINCWGC